MQTAARTSGITAFESSVAQPGSDSGALTPPVARKSPRRPESSTEDPAATLYEQVLAELFAETSYLRQPQCGPRPCKGPNS